MKNILLDTGPLVALMNRRDKHHARILAFTRSFGGIYLTTWPVITEAMYLLRHSHTAQLNVLEWVRRGGLEMVPIDASDVDRLMELMQKYRDLPMDLADGSLVVAAERLGIREILSIDSDYDVYRMLKKEPLVNVLQSFQMT